MQVTIDKAGLADLQARDLAIGLARPSPAPGVRSALMLTLPADSLLATSFAITPESRICCFAANGPFANFDTVAPTLLSRPFDRVAVSGRGAICTFDGTAIVNDTSGTSGIDPGRLFMVNDAEDNTRNLAMGIAETFGLGDGRRSPATCSLLRTVDWKMSWALDGLPAAAFLFVISKSVPAGTILAPLPPQRKSSTARAVSEFVIGPRLLVDTDDEGLVVAYNPAGSGFTSN